MVAWEVLFFGRNGVHILGKKLRFYSIGVVEIRFGIGD